jgi:hypothetical protein
MAQPREYTTARYVLMQATLWGVLIAGVGLAELVDRHINSSGVSQLGPELTAGPLHFRLPLNWVYGRRLDPTMIVRAVEVPGPQTTVTRRVISVYRQLLARRMTPDDYLLRRGLLEEIFGSNQPPVQTGAATMGGQPALMLQGEEEIQSDQGTFVESDMVICCVFANRQAVTVWLSRLGPFTSSDTLLLREVANSVRMDGLPTQP